MCKSIETKAVASKFDRLKIRHCGGRHEGLQLFEALETGQAAD